MKLRRKWKYLPYILTMLFSIGGVIGFPLLLRCPWINEQVSCFAYGLEHAQYKEAYIGVWGGIIGSGLGVLGAVLMQGVAENHQQSAIVRRSAVVIYYDMLLFYKEISPFASCFLGNKNWNKKNIDQLMYLKRPILISDDWIHDVANMNDAFIAENRIQEIYEFYGTAVTIQHLISSADSILRNKAELEKYLLTIGGRDDKKTVYLD